MKIFPLGACGGRSAPSVHLGPPHISETIRNRKLKFYKHIDGPSAFLDMKIFPLGVSHGGSAPSVNLGPPHISEIIRDRKMKIYTHLDRAKCTFWK